MPYEDVLVHTAVPAVRKEEGGAWVQGEPSNESDPRPGVPVACCLFLPLSGEQQAPRGRRAVRVPLLLLSHTDEDGADVDLGPADEVDVTAPELTGPDPVRWQIDGYPQPFGPPGEELIGKQVNVKRVED